MYFTEGGWGGGGTHRDVIPPHVRITFHSDKGSIGWLTTLLSLSVRGSNSPFIGSKFLELLKRKNVDVAFLSETHLEPLYAEQTLQSSCILGGWI